MSFIDILDLFVKIGIKDNASKEVESLSSKIGNGLKTAAKVGTVAVAGAATAISALTKMSIENFAEYEQLIGGAELMFGDAFATVQKNAQEAYRTVQMSQNEYLQQVNGFATGLKKSLGDNEQAAAELAHRIVQAEADVVAATGNTAENVQNAFNGIMKNNFTMLDNLQIGIVPTKEGFADLIDQVNEWNEEHGRFTNYEMENLADMQSALVDYIEMVGLSGYAQNEAASTIQGSLATTKAAWSNLLTGLSDGEQDLSVLVENLISSASNTAKLILPRITKALTGSIGAISDVVSGVIDILPETITTALPQIASAAIEIIKTLVDSLANNSSEIANVAVEMISVLALGIVDMLPAILDAGVDIILSLCEALTKPEMIEELTVVAIETVITLAAGILSALPQIVSSAADLISALVQGLLNGLMRLFTTGAELVGSFVQGLKDKYGSLSESGDEIVETIKEAILNKLEQAKTWGMDLITNFIDGIKSRWNALKETVSSVAQTVKDFIGFSEPEKGPLSNFHTYAPDMIDLFVQGIKDNEWKLRDQLSKSLNLQTEFVNSANQNQRNGGISVVQNIYSNSTSAIDLMQEAQYRARQAVIFGV